MEKEMVGKIIGERNLEDHETGAEYMLDILAEERERLILIITDDKLENRNYFINRFIEVDNYIFEFMNEVYIYGS